MEGTNNSQENSFKEHVLKYLGFFFEDYCDIHLRIISIKKEDAEGEIWQIIYLRGDFSSIKNEKVKFFKSKFSKILLLEYSIDIENFFKIFTLQQFHYSHKTEGDIILEWLKGLDFPNTFEEYKNIISHSGLNNILETIKPIYLFYRNNLYSDKVEFHHQALSNVIFKVNDESIICDGNDFFKKFLKADYQNQPTLLLCFPLESINFRYKLKERANKEIIEYEWVFENNDYNEFLHPFYDIGNTYKNPTGLNGIIELGNSRSINMQLLYNHPEIIFGHNWFFRKDLPEREEIIQTIQFRILSDIKENFRKCVIGELNGETDIQDDLESFFLAKEYKFKRERERVQFSEKTFQPDFTFNVLDLAIEVKYVDSHKKMKSVIDEMSADLIPYSKRWKHIFYIVYDKGGNINNEEAFNSDFNIDGLFTSRSIVIKH